MGFATELHVRRDTANEQWVLTEPLVWRGDWETIYIKAGFATDFASVPKPFRWLMDSGGPNAAAGVLHDAVWRESKTDPNTRRVDPWHADGMLRRALRESGVSHIPRNMMWTAVRWAAIVPGLRFGRKGPSTAAKLARMAMWSALAVPILGAPLVMITVAWVLYRLLTWISAPFVKFYLSRKIRKSTPSSTLFPPVARPGSETQPGFVDGLLVISHAKPGAPTLQTQQMHHTDPELEQRLDSYLAEYSESPAPLSWADSEDARFLHEQRQRPRLIESGPG